jgi:hypothetical protein
MKTLKNKDLEPEVCLECIAWKHFGGRNAEDVTMGPMCVCNGNWTVVNKYISIMKTKKLLII